jgi:hypothetical protein
LYSRRLGGYEERAVAGSNTPMFYQENALMIGYYHEAPQRTNHSTSIELERGWRGISLLLQDIPVSALTASKVGDDDQSRSGYHRSE